MTRWQNRDESDDQSDGLPSALGGEDVFYAEEGREVGIQGWDRSRRSTHYRHELLPLRLQSPRLRERS